MKRRATKGCKRVGLIMLVMMITAMSGAFAGSLWNDASDIAEDNLSLIPTYTTVTYVETNGAGVQLLTDKGLIIHGEDANDNLTVREIGSDEIFDLIGSFTDGMVFTPFSSDVEIDDYELSSESELVNGKETSVYYFEATVADNAIAQSISSYEDEGTDVSITGYVYISEADGSVVKVEQDYSVYDNYTGSLEIEQEIYFDYNGESWVPIVAQTTGELTHTLSNKSVELTSFNLVEEFSEFFEAGSYVR